MGDKSIDQKVDYYTDGSESGLSEEYWVDWFLRAKGNEYFCEVDEDFITDRFNLTGLSTEVSHLQYAAELITDALDLDSFQDPVRQEIDADAKHLYGLIHARYILTPRGLTKMMEKYKLAHFGKCPRVNCYFNPLLPVGLYDVAGQSSVKLYCTKCEDLYIPKSTRHANIDGAYFGTSFPAMILQAFPQLLPTKTNERHVPTIFGFKMHEHAKWARWQDKQRQEMNKRIQQYNKEQQNIQQLKAQPSNSTPSVQSQQSQTKSQSQQSQSRSPSAQPQVEAA
ncbi:Casein kinase II subunit beta-2 [Yarrowia sp. B02]|nr:Casein kinase II subunit beta-2 [Yarrowia sp. B02]